MRLEKAIFINRAPFKNLTLDFGGENIVVLSGINGTGKTTILSHIVDSFYEMARKEFDSDFIGRENKFYRLSASLFSLDNSQPSLVYFRFTHDKKIVDYIDLRGNCTETEYASLIDIPDPIPFKQFQNEFKVANIIKYVSAKKEEIHSIFDSGLITYFPAYRYEIPGFLNDPYTVSLSFKTKSSFSGYLKNPIEVTSDLPNIADWIMDTVLDMKLYPNDANKPFIQINQVLSEILQSKTKCPVRVGIGSRQSGSTRIQIIKSDAAGGQLYPSIFNMSSGELALLCLFCELLKQADSLNCTNDTIAGIVLVDEIEKHLHIKLQKEALPRLVKLFPKVQFIVTSHSPFLNLGLSEEPELMYQIYDLDSGGICCHPQNTPLFIEVYSMMIAQNEQFAEKHRELLSSMNNDSTPLIITEGKTDWKHLSAAKDALKIDDLNVEFYQITDSWGDSNLMNLLKFLSMIPQKRKIIGIFDHDNPIICEQLAKDSDKFKDFSNNVYAFVLPLVNEEIYGTAISIEHYYPREQLLREAENHRRLFLGEEFFCSGNSKDGKYQTKFNGIQNKVKSNGIIDDKVYDREDLAQDKSIALSKSEFADFVYNKDKFAADFDFSSFSKIFDIVKIICSI